MSEIDIYQASEIVVKSKFLSELIGETEYGDLKKEIPDFDKLTPSEICEIAPQIQDAVEYIKEYDKFLSFRILSDDEDGSECGPWLSDVYGACGVWIVSSIDRDELWFDDRDDAIMAAYDYAHEDILEKIDHGMCEFQRSNDEIDDLDGSENKKSENYLAEMDARQTKRWRESGFTVNEVESTSDELVVTFPRNHQSVQKQRATEKNVRVSVEIGYQSHSVVLTAEEWRQVNAGEDLIKEIEDYSKGKLFTYVFSFNNNCDDYQLVVTYDDETGFTGDVNDAHIEIVE